MPKNLELFKTVEPERSRAIDQPLAERLRPVSWADFQGLAALDSSLISQLQKGVGVPPSMILWGPPGTGKTTFARLVGGAYDCDFISFSAVLGGVKDVREIVDRAKHSIRRTILFTDEIHRFNRAQQDAFLPHVEDGTIVLIGATTENPSFYLNAALLSRALVVVFPSLAEGDLTSILRRATEELKIKLSKASAKMVIDFAGGDARRLLNVVEGLVESGAISPQSEALVNEGIIAKFLKDRGSYFYDRDGEEHYNMASAFIKSLRGGDPDAALYWGFRMIAGGEDPRFIARRMMIFASEDIGNADPGALTLAVSTAEAFDRLGLPEGRIPLAHCITYLACAPKSNRSYRAMHQALTAIAEQPKAAVPLHLRNAPTKLMEQLGYGSEYQYPHDQEGGHVSGVQYLPDQCAGRQFYQPSQYGEEREIAARLKEWRRRE